MKRGILAAASIALGLAVGTAAFAQGTQVGPAKTPGGSMPAAPSNSTPQSGSSSGSPMAGAGMQNDNGGQAGMSRMRTSKRMRHHRRAKRRSM